MNRPQEAQQGAPSDAPATPPIADAEVPEAFDENLMAEVRALNRGQRPTEQPAPPADPPAPATPPANEEPADGISTEDFNRLKETVESVANRPTQPSKPAPTAQEVYDDMVAAVKKEGGEEMTDEGAEFMVKTILRVSNAIAAPLQRRVQQLETHGVQQQQREVVNEFTTFFRSEMEGLGITDAEDQEEVQDHILAKGQRLYGEKFSPGHAKDLLIQYNNRRVRTQQRVEDGEAQQQQRREENAPPVRHTHSQVSAAESMHNAIRDPKNRDWDFGGRKMKAALKQILNRGRSQ